MRYIENRIFENDNGDGVHASYALTIAHFLRAPKRGPQAGTNYEELLLIVPIMRACHKAHEERLPEIVLEEKEWKEVYDRFTSPDARFVANEPDILDLIEAIVTAPVKTEEPGVLSAMAAVVDRIEKTAMAKPSAQYGPRARKARG